MEIQELKVKAAQIRMDLLTIIHRAKTGHTGGIAEQYRHFNGFIL